jgi:hypothetical protein
LKKIIFFLAVIIFISAALGTYYNKTYLKEDRLSNDIQQRLKDVSISMVSDYEVLQQKDFKNVRIILYRYNSNSFNLVACSIYEKTPNGRFKFIKGQELGITTGTMMAKIKEEDKIKHYYLIHFGYIGGTDINRYEITLGNKIVTKEYNKEESFIEPYSMENGGVGIKPIYENKVTQ